MLSENRATRREFLSTLLKISMTIVSITIAMHCAKLHTTGMKTFRFATCSRAEETVVASKMLYASHYFWTALELRVLVSDPSRGTGFWFVTINSSRSDGLSGFFGRLIRSHIRQEVQKGVLAYLTETKKKLERQAR
jgi:hypothetical protein